MSEQKEKANRISLKQQYEDEQNTAVQERLSKEEEARNRAKLESVTKGKAEGVANNDSAREVKIEKEAPRPASMSGIRTFKFGPSESQSAAQAAGGMTLGQAMLANRPQAQGPVSLPQHSRNRNKDSDGWMTNRFRRVVIHPEDYAEPQSQSTDSRNVNHADRPPVRKNVAAERGRDKKDSTTVRNVPQRVPNPFGAPAATAKSAAKPTFGWGAGSTITAPLPHSQGPKVYVASGVLKPGEAGEEAGPNSDNQDESAQRVPRDGHYASAKPNDNATEEVLGSQDPGTEVSSPKSSSGEGNEGARNTGLQKEESGGQTAEQLQPSSTETGASEAFDHGDFLNQPGYTESHGAEPPSASSIPQDSTSSLEVGAPEAHDLSPANEQTLVEPPAISYSSEPSEPPPGTVSSGRFEDDGEPAPQPQRQQPPQTEQRLKSLEQQEPLDRNLFGSFENDAEVIPETRHDDPPAAKDAKSSPLAQEAQQAQQTQEKHADRGAIDRHSSSSISARPQPPAAPVAPSPPPPQSAVPTPPPPPTVSPPPSFMIPAGGQLAWQPIEGHTQGGQWVWQPSPAPSSAPPAIAAQVAPQVSTQIGPDLSQRSNYTPPVRTPEVPSISLGDSGYRATPFRADEYQPHSTFDEGTAANWQHLRKKNDEPMESPSQPALSSNPAPLPRQQTNSRIKYDDDSWVDNIFDNHVREREERLKAQSARQQQLQVRSEGREAPDHIQTRATQPPSLQQPEGSRRLYDGSAQGYRDSTCARCGEKGHIARFCQKSDISPFDMPSDGSRSRSALGSRLKSTDRVGNPFENREPERSKAPRAAWGFGQGRSTERAYEPSREPRYDSVKRFVPGPAPDSGLMQQDESAASHRFEPIGGRRLERAGDVNYSHSDRDASAHYARRSDRLDVDQEGGENAPALDTRQLRRKAARKSRWADAEEDEVVVEKSRGAGRKAQRAGRQEYDEDEDEEAEARERFRARKAARQAEKEAREEERRRSARREREVKKAEDATPIAIPEFVSVQQLSQLLGVRYEQFIESLQDLGYDDVFPGMTLNSETSGMIAMEYNFDPTIDTGVREEEERDLKPRPELEDQQFLPTRPPVVTIMGHVDHGKTTILDYLRKSSVAAGEAGGITQHIGAFSVPMASSGTTITFLDTPGHAAFLAMRQRGANVTDIVILVVAADDSVKPQTLEAIKHAKAAGVPMIVAINKIDKEEADIERVKQDLARHGVEIEDYGGETQIVPVSGKTGKGMDELEETVVALSEILDRRAEIDGPVEGWVLEATTKERGRVATVLVRRGTLKPGAVIVAGKTWARVRTLRNEGGRELSKVGPGMPIEVDGWRDQPMAGDEVLEAPTEQKATSVTEFRQELEERQRAAADMEAINESRRRASERQRKEREAAEAVKQAQRTANAEGGTADVSIKPDNLDAPQQEQTTGQMDVPFIIKADVSGSAEAVSTYILSVSNPLIAPSILLSQVGPIHESDIELADAAGAHIIAFNLPPDPQMQGQAEARGIKILENNIIYRVLDDVKAVLEEKLPPIVSQRVLGEAEVSAAFEISLGGRKKMMIAGCKVRNGTVGKGSRVRIMRGSEKIYDGMLGLAPHLRLCCCCCC